MILSFHGDGAEDFRTLRTRTEMDRETLVSSCFNHLTRLVAREDFIMNSQLYIPTGFTIMESTPVHIG
jgi:hypothetical protein